MNLTVNGIPVAVPPGSTLLQACHAAGVEVPTLCHDDRLHPAGVCRLCLVQQGGREHPVPACSTPAADGMAITTRTPELEATRRALLEMLARDYPADAVRQWPEKPFHRLLHQYHVHPGADGNKLAADAQHPFACVPSTSHNEVFHDTTHPYLAADFSKCVHCLRCVRICADVQGQFVWHAYGRGAHTRILPDGPSLLASPCVSCGACVDTCPSGALEDQSILRLGEPEKWTHTTCPYCGIGCEMLVGTRDNCIVQVKPALDAPVSKGHLCVKGRYAFDFTHAADRVTEPMIRRNGVWQKVTWTEAVNYVAGRLSAIAAWDGPNSIGVLGSARGTNEENYLAQKFARVVLGTNNVDCCARVCHGPTAAGMKATLGTGAATNSFDDIERASAFLVCGCNPTEAHPVVGARIKQAVLRGAKLIVIDPRATELARLADVHLALHPGTNVPLLNALAHVIVTENLVDADALRDRVEDFAAFREFIAAWTPERAARLTGVSADLIRQAARLYATAKPAMCFHGLGMTEHIQGTEGVMCLVNLALLTGNFGRPGSGVNPLRGQNNVQGSAHMGCEPGNLTGYVALEQARDLFETAWQVPLPHTKGLNLMEMVDAAGTGKLKALWAIGYDVALTNPNSTATRAALGKLDLVIVQDLFMNELAREFGNVFLSACSSFEKDGTFMNSERRVQRVRKAFEPLGNSKPDWEIICEVAKAMHSETGFNFTSPEEIWNEVRRVWPAGAGISYARLERGGLQWPCPAEDHPGTAILHTQSFPHGPRAPLKRVDYAASEQAACEEFPFLLTTGRTLYQFNAGTMTRRTPNALLRATDTLDLAPADAERLGLRDGDRVRVRSLHGEATMPVRVDPRVKAGELFATFHAVESFLNQVTGPGRDRVTLTPEYKVVAVRLEKA
ncbi:MAG: fdhA [Limisphaerales bacterium]|nr:MAG: fdhA [Limisphaerales bacterium]KAG0509253.1 MAG: fdhA [Limisphaerales bacterium]TXT52208.1 MAG: fdhA [Limisphaerales bacterium]